MESKLLYSEELNNIPKRKIEERIASIIKACEVCSKLDMKNGMNGICNKCNVQIKAIQRYALSNIPVSYWDITKDFIGYQPLKDKYDELVNDLQVMFSNGTSLLVCGNHGTGKTLFGCCLLKRAALKGYDCFYTTLSDAVAALTSIGYNEQFIVRKQLQGVHILVIDEMDSRFVSSAASSDLFARSLETIIRTRLANKLCTVVISNSPNIVESLNGQLKESLGSLFHLLEKVVVLGEDKRKMYDLQPGKVFDAIKYAYDNVEKIISSNEYISNITIYQIPTKIQNFVNGIEVAPINGYRILSEYTLNSGNATRGFAGYAETEKYFTNISIQDIESLPGVNGTRIPIKFKNTGNGFSYKIGT